MRWTTIALLFVPALAAAKPPARAQALKLLKAQVPETRSVSDVLEDVGGGRFPVLFVLKGKDCLTRKIDGLEEKNCSDTSPPAVALVTRGADGTLTLGAWSKLPTVAAPWDQPEPMKWGIHFIEDYDADGKPELLLAYGYHGPTEWAVGDTWYKHWVILNLDPLAPAIHVVLDQTPQAMTPSVESKWKLLPGAKGGAKDIQIVRREGTYDEGKGERVFAETRQMWTYDRASDRWIEKK